MKIPKKDESSQKEKCSLASTIFSCALPLLVLGSCMKLILSSAAASLRPSLFIGLSLLAYWVSFLKLLYQWKKVESLVLYLYFTLKAKTKGFKCKSPGEAWDLRYEAKTGELRFLNYFILEWVPSQHPHTLLAPAPPISMWACWFYIKIVLATLLLLMKCLWYNFANSEVLYNHGRISYTNIVCELGGSGKHLLGDILGII